MTEKLTTRQNLLAVMIVLVGGLAFFSVTVWEDWADKRDIDGWAQEHNLTVQQVDHRIFTLNRGPYPYAKRGRIYRVVTDKGVFWIKYNPVRSSIFREDSGGYTRVE
jgi:hypothetical protein